MSRRTKPASSLAQSRPPSASPSPAQPATLSIGLDLSSAGAAGGSGRRRGQGDWTPPFDEGRLIDLVQTAERGAVDFVAFGTDFRLETDRARPRTGILDAAVVSSRLAKRTARIGLIPTVSEAHLDPANIAAAVTAVDAVSGGRAAWQAAGTDLPNAIDSVRAAWRVNGERPAPVVVRAEDEASRAHAASRADVVRILATDAESALAQRRRIRELAAAENRNPDDVRVLVELFVVTGPDAASARERLDLLERLNGSRPRQASIEFVGTHPGLADLIREWFGSGAVDGFVITPSSLYVDLFGVVDGVVPILREAGIFRRRYEGTTLTRSLSLPRARGPRTKQAA